MPTTSSVTERGGDWDKHDRAWEAYYAKKANPQYKPEIFEKIAAAKGDEWELVGPDIERISVPGGWLFRTREYISGGVFGGGGFSVALAFVPFPSTPDGAAARA
jgi:hypothetical protein